MKAEIISIGTEITTGNILNTNSYFISKALLKVGIETYYQTSVDDNVDRLKEVIEIACNRADLIITIGGLGPTEDDLTKETIADYLGLDLIDNDDMKENIIGKLKKYENIPKNNFKQASLIDSGRFIENVVGTAPGIYLKYEGITLVLLPGPPRELEPMFLREVLPLLKKNDYVIMERSVNLTGIGESFIESEIKDIIHMYDDIEVATFGKIQNVEIRMIGRGNNKDILEGKMNHIISLLIKRFNDYIYAYNNEAIESIVFDLLKEHNLKISFAESCTGGLLSSRFVRQAGISDVFESGFITYSNQAKINELGVLPLILKEFGAVSEETSKAMVKGLLKRSRVDLGVSITGIAGPDSDGSKKSVGLVYVSIGNGKKLITKRVEYSGDRKNIQDRVVEYSLFQIRDFIINNY